MIQVKTIAHNTEILIGLKIVSYLYAWNKVDFGNEWSCTFLFLFCFLSPDYTGECWLKYCASWIVKKSTFTSRSENSRTRSRFNACIKSEHPGDKCLILALMRAVIIGIRILIRALPGDPLQVLRAVLNSQLLQSRGPVRRFSSPCLPPVRL